jgi:hypothetical protein
LVVTAAAGAVAVLVGSPVSALAPRPADLDPGVYVACGYSHPALAAGVSCMSLQADVNAAISNGGGLIEMMPGR